MKKFIALHPIIFKILGTLLIISVPILLFVSGIITYSKMSLNITLAIVALLLIILFEWTKNFEMNVASKYFGEKEIEHDYKYCIKAEYYYEEACEVYCKQKNKEYDDLTLKDEDKIWEYARNFIAYLVQWLIENDLFCYNEEDEETRELVKKCKERKIKPGKIVQEVCDERLIEDDLSPKIRDFLINYYVEDTDDYENFVNEEIKKELYGFGFEWEDYDKWKKYIDREYKKYLNEKNNNE